MKIIFNKDKLINVIANYKNLGFVPTMGAIHIGHVSLVKKSIKQCSKTVVSIFVNKPQFNKKGDFNKYPRTLKSDIKILKRLNVNYLYLPLENEIYPDGKNTNIKIDHFHRKLCGNTRPGHFFAVADVIDRFINIINPSKIYFGEKDYQQFKIIEDFIRKKNINTKVVLCKTVRENNGLACSSRNILLTKKEREIGSKVYKFIKSKRLSIFKKKITIKDVKKKIMSFGVSKIDYIEILNINNLIKPYKKKKKLKIFFSYFLKNTRLIDNI
jgi:pantoate--beta-alanine ligase